MADTTDKIAELLKQRDDEDESEDCGDEYKSPMQLAKTLPDGRKIDDLSDAQLSRALMRFEIDGAQKGNSRKANEALYQAAVMSEYCRGGEISVALWRLGFDETDHDDNDKEGEK